MSSVYQWVAYLGPDLVAVRVFRWAPTQNGQSPIPLRGQVSDGFGRGVVLGAAGGSVECPVFRGRDPRARGPHLEVAGVC